MIKIRAFINGWNDRCQPFVWTKTADQILTKPNRKTTSVAVHYLCLHAYASAVSVLAPVFHGAFDPARC